MQQALQRSVDTTRKIEEGGLVRDAGLEQDIARGHSISKQQTGNAFALIRYAGDAAGICSAFNC